AVSVSIATAVPAGLLVEARRPGRNWSERGRPCPYSRGVSAGGKGFGLAHLGGDLAGRAADNFLVGGALAAQSGSPDFRITRATARATGSSSDGTAFQLRDPNTRRRGGAGTITPPSGRATRCPSASRWRWT